MLFQIGILNLFFEFFIMSKKRLIFQSIDVRRTFVSTSVNKLHISSQDKKQIPKSYVSKKMFEEDLKTSRKIVLLCNVLYVTIRVKNLMSDLSYR